MVASSRPSVVPIMAYIAKICRSATRQAPIRVIAISRPFMSWPPQRTEAVYPFCRTRAPHSRARHRAIHRSVEGKAT